MVMDDKARIDRTTQPALRAGCVMPPIRSGRRAASTRPADFTSGWRRTASRSPSRAVRASIRARPIASPSRRRSAGAAIRRRWSNTALDYWVARYQRPDGLFRTLVAADGSPLDDRALLYDQAFGLLAFNVSAAVGESRARARAAVARAARRWCSST